MRISGGKAAEECAEIVFRGHPDKIADQASDGVLDMVLSADKHARVGIECLVKGSSLIVAGEIGSSFSFTERDIAQAARSAVSNTGWDPLDIRVLVSSQTRSLEGMVASGCAADQATVVGYANDRSDAAYMPPAFRTAQAIQREIEDRVAGRFGLGYDGKVQVVGGGERGVGVLVSIQHKEGVDAASVVAAALAPLLPPPFTLTVNPPDGAFLIGGPQADAGVTGRKIVADSYGPTVPVGGGAFSGKDPSKLDRSGAYLARHIAKSLVAHYGFAECLVSISWMPGFKEPVSIAVVADGNWINLSSLISRNFPTTPDAICSYFDLRSLLYLPTAVGGHFGRDFPWDNVAPITKR